MPESPATIIENLGDAIVVHVQYHDMTEQHLTEIQTDITNASAKQNVPLILDLAKVKYIPSLALGLFVRIANSFKSKQQRFILASPQPTVRQVLAITRLDRAMEVQDSVDTALKAVRPG
ncbi:MAG TPA: STAS domain-containing protein [Tepidisphaeraceae bacterium]|jgi:anti-anti-sigma factor